MADSAKKEHGSLSPDEAEAVLCRLMAGYLEGRIDAFDELYAALAGRLRGYLVSLCRDAALADDLVQDTFLQLHRSRRTFQPGRPVTPWVFAIARHVYLMNRRRTARRLRFEDRLAAEAARSAATTDVNETWVDREVVRRVLKDVPADQRRPVVLHHVAGWSFAEIAAKLGIRLNAAKTRAFRGMKRMREQLEGRR